jgi:isoamylase
MMKESNNPKRMRPPPDRMGSQSSQAAETTDATTDLTTLKRPLHEYVATVSERTEVRRGVPLPMGTHEYGRGVNFAFFSRHASRVRLELFDHPHDAMTAKGIDLDPARHRTGDVWHIWVEGIQPGQLYAYRVDGPYQPNDGHRFNFNRLLLDPFATAISPLPDWDFGPARGDDPSAPERDVVCSTVDDAGAMPKCVFMQEHFHWQDDQPPRHPWSKTMIYETHVRGFTIHPTSQVMHPGTYRGLMEKIPYFQDLGVTAVELMPIQEFNAHQVIGINPHSGQPLTSTPSPAKGPRAASISSPVTMASRCMIS